MGNRLPTRKDMERSKREREQIAKLAEGIRAEDRRARDKRRAQKQQRRKSEQKRKALAFAQALARITSNN